MSSTRLPYDTCAYNVDLRQSIAPLNYMLDPAKYENCNKCRMELGIVGGTAVSHINGNLVDLENDLRNQNRPYSHCPEYNYLPNENQGKEFIKPVCHPVIDMNMSHLPSCQMVGYGSVPLTPELNISRCQ